MLYKFKLYVKDGVMGKIGELKCSNCGGNLGPKKVSKYPVWIGILVMAYGFFHIRFSFYVGIPIVLIGFYLAFASRQLLVCDDCHLSFQRVVGEG